jgi:AcrR family transcriptional regulator
MDNKLMETAIYTKKGQETQQKIIDTALSMIRNQGFDEVTIRAICEKAKIGLGTFYHYFRSKEDVLLAYIDEENIELLQFYNHIEKKSYADAILSVANHYLDMYFFKGTKLVSQVYSMVITSGFNSRQIDKNAFSKIIRDVFINGQLNGEFVKEFSVDTYHNMMLGEWFYLTSLWCNAPDSFNIREEIKNNFAQLNNLVSCSIKK